MLFLDTQPKHTFLATAAVAVREVKHVASNTPRAQMTIPVHPRPPALRAMAQPRVNSVLLLLLLSCRVVRLLLPVGVRYK